MAWKIYNYPCTLKYLVSLLISGFFLIIILWFKVIGVAEFVKKEYFDVLLFLFCFFTNLSFVWASFF